MTASFGPQISVQKEYYINFPTTENAGGKPCYTRVQIIGIAMVSEREFDNVTCVWS